MSSTYQLEGTHRRRIDVDTNGPTSGADVNICCRLATDHGADRAAMGMVLDGLLVLDGTLIRPGNATALFVIDPRRTEGLWHFKISFHYDGWQPPAPKWWPFGAAKREEALHAELDAAMKFLAESLLQAWALAGLDVAGHGQLYHLNFQS